MSPCPTSVRWFLLMIAIGLFGIQPSAAAQTANVPQTGIPGGGYRIAGTAVSKTDGHPLAHARILVRDVKNRQKFQSMVTSENGKFEFSGLPVGKYSLEGSKRGFISASYDQHDQFSTAIVTGAAFDTETLILRLAPAALITGKVLDEAGEPVRHATVVSYYDDHSAGVDQIRQFRGTQTDDQGAYEIALMPGTYFLSASAKPWYAVHPSSGQPDSARTASPSAPVTIDHSLDVTYPLTYYPDVTDADSATPIPIRGGERLQVDIHLNPVPSLHLFFHVPGNPGNGFAFPQLEQPAFDGSSFLHDVDTRMDTPGLVEITGIPAGRYNVHFNGPGQPMQMNGVDLTKDGEEVDASSAEALSTVKISVRVQGGASLPPRLFVGLRSGRRPPVVLQALDSKGEAELQRVPAGRLEVLVGGPGSLHYISHISAEGAEVSGRTLNVTAGSSPSVSLTVASGASEIEGAVRRQGKAFAGAMVVLVPQSPEMDRDLFRRDQSDLDGTFSLHGVIPGSYTILAIENGWDLDWSQPGVIAPYLKRGKLIEVGNQVGRPINLPEPIEVQSK